MWCHNARQEHFEPVWVVLTDLSKVCWLMAWTRQPYRQHRRSVGPPEQAPSGWIAAVAVVPTLTLTMHCVANRIVGCAWTGKDIL